MKGLFCSICYSIRSLPREDLKPVFCDCGNLCGWWLDGAKGIARYYSPDPHSGYFVGWNNQYLRGVVELQMCNTDALARELHDLCTDAPGFHFDR